MSEQSRSSGRSNGRSKLSITPCAIIPYHILHRHEFEWKREECYMIRKPDPPVLVAVTKEPAGRIKTSTVQLLDYNLNR